jgi:hypothetical protein
MQIVKKVILLLALELTMLATFTSANEANDVDKLSLERIAFNIMSMIEFKLNRGGKVSVKEINLIKFIMNEIQRRIEKEREANTVYWYLRQG